ncbi:SLC13 family permease, partial [Weissella fangxianensis]
MKALVYKILNDRTLWVTTVLLILTLFVGHIQLDDIDIQTILSLLSLMILISLYEGEGLLKYVALTIIKKCQTTRQVQLTIFLLVFFSAMFLTNDVAIITFIPIFVVIAQKIHINAVLPIILLTVFANLGSAVTPFGNPQNIYLASHYQLQIGDFFQMSWPLGLISFLFVLFSSLFFRSSNLELEQLTLDLPAIRPKQTKLLIAGSFVVLAGLLHLLPIMVSLVVSVLLTLVINKKRFLQVDYELNPVSWSNFQNLRGFTMFSKEVQIEAVTMYLQGIPPYKIRKKFGIKGTDTIRNWVTNIKELGIYGVNNASRSKTNYQYSFKIKVIKWRLDHKASLPVTAKKFHIR